MAATNNKMSCCPEGSHPELKEDTTRKLDGVVSEIEGLPIYTVKGDAEAAKSNPSVSGGAIVVIYDVHGFKGGRVKSFCDALAKSGLMVIMPDFYKENGGGGVNDYGGFGAKEGQDFIKKATFPQLEKNMDKVVAHLKEAHGIDRVGIIGFCWGCWANFKFGSVAEKYSMQCGVNCHPSLQISELFFGQKVDEVARQNKVPMMLMPAQGDPAFVKAGGSVEKILKENKLDVEIREFPDMKHGWTIRGDTADPTIARDVEKAVEYAKGFFLKHMGAGSSL